VADAGTLDSGASGDNSFFLLSFQSLIIYVLHRMFRYRGPLSELRVYNNEYSGRDPRQQSVAVDPVAIVRSTYMPIIISI